MIYWFFLNLVMSGTLFWLIYSAYQFKKTLVDLNEYEKKYLASIKRSIDVCEEYNRIMIDQNNELKARILFNKFMKRAKQKDDT